MNIHEHQAKEILRRENINVGPGIVAYSAAEVKNAAEKLKTITGSEKVVVKAQIHAGGRGKAGGVKVVNSAQEAEKFAKDLLGKVLVTHQTGPEGKEVKRLYIEAVAPKIIKEYYLSFVIDRANNCISIIASAEGGVEIEQVSAENPEKIIKTRIKPAYGLSPFHGRKIAKGLGLTSAQQKNFAALLNKLYTTFIKYDAVQLEINPLALIEGNDFMCLDAKFGFDDNALYRHKDIEELRDPNEEQPLEIEAGKHGLSYIKMDGSIGCMVNGAGLAMATMDIIKNYKHFPANFLDVGGGASKEKVSAAFKIILSDPAVRAILVNIFGGIMRCDIIAEGIIEAAKESKITVPLVVRLEGTNVELGKAILNKSGLNIITANDLEDAAVKVTQAVKRL